jgi:hypothetical protein
MNAPTTFDDSYFDPRSRREYRWRWTVGLKGLIVEARKDGEWSRELAVKDMPKEVARRIARTGQ